MEDPYQLAKRRLQGLRRTDPRATLAAALLAVAQDHGFPAWRDLKADRERRQKEPLTRFLEACGSGNVAGARNSLAVRPDLVRPGKGWTGLHEAAKQGHLEIVRLLLEHGAEPNAREPGDNTYALHWAAAHGHVEVVRALLDAGGDVHGIGDMHELDAIGWATVFRAPGDHPVVSFLIERGARHHIFSVMSVGDLNLIRALVEENPAMLDRRMSGFEQRMTPLQFAMSRKRSDIMDLLIELGAEPSTPEQRVTADMAELATSTRKCIPMIHAPDIARTLDWYASIGFKEINRNESDGVVNWGMLAFGAAELMLNVNGNSLWFYTDNVDDLYRALKSQAIEFVEEINDTFYGARQFGIRDLNGYILYFIQPV
jgi:ankyrin repeat protein